MSDINRTGTRVYGKLLLSLIIAVAASCAGVKNSPYNNNPGEIVTSIYLTIYDSPPEEINLTITNNSRQTAYYGENYTVEKMTGGKWVPFARGESSVATFDNEVQPGQSRIEILNLLIDRDEFSPGKYRVVKGIYLDITGEIYCTAGFEIK